MSHSFYVRVKRAKIKISAIPTLVLSHYTLGWNIQRRFMDIKRNFPSVHHHYYEGNAKKLLLIVVPCATQGKAKKIEDRNSIKLDAVYTQLP